MQPTTRFLQGHAQEVYGRVFIPLAQQSEIIKCSKKAYGASPFVKLRTVYEMDPTQTQVSCLVIDSAYSSRYNSFMTGAAKLCTESRNIFGSVFNFASPNSMWNCLSSKTGQVLETAVNAFCERKKAIEQEAIALEDLKDLRGEVKEIQATLASALKTVFYIYRTYHQCPEEQEDLASSNGQQESIRPQYLAISHLIQDLDAFLVRTDLPNFYVESDDDIPALNEDTTPPKKSLQGNSPEVQIAPAKPVDEDVMADKKLVFKSPEAASRWFKMTLTRCRAANETVPGLSCHANLMNVARIAKTVPQAFAAFAKSLDKVFKDPLAHYDAVREICFRFEQILMTNGQQIKLSQHNSFSKLFKELCSLNVDRTVYQDFFKALMNSEKTAPFGLQCEGAILNAIMNSEYFPMFDTEHEI